MSAIYVASYYSNWEFNLIGWFKVHGNMVCDCSQMHFGSLHNCLLIWSFKLLPHSHMQVLWLHAKTILFIAPFKSRLIGFFCIATNGASVEAGLHDHPGHQKCMHNQMGNYEVFACKYVMDICLLHVCKSLKIVCSGFVCIFDDAAV